MIDLPNLVVLGVLVFIVTVISAPFLFSKWQAFFRNIGLFSKLKRNGLPTARPAGKLTLPVLGQNIPRPCLNRRSVLGTFRQGLMFPYVVFSSLRRPTNTSIPLPSDSLLNVISSPGDFMPKFSSESALTQEARTRSLVPYAGIPRRLRRQGWLMQLPFRNLTPLEERLSPPPSVLSASLILRDVRNTHHGFINVDSVFSPRIAELSPGGIRTPVLTPISPSLSSPIPPLAMTQTIARNGILETECSSPVHFESPLGPSSLTLALPNGLADPPEDEICTVDIQDIGSERQLSTENDDSSLYLLDKFPQPPSDVEEKGYSITPTSLAERSNSTSELKTLPHAQIDTATDPDGERETGQQGVAVNVHVQERTVSLSSRDGYRLVGCHQESIKASQSEIIFRADTLPVCGEVHRSFSMPFGMAPTEWDAKGLGFLQYHSHVSLVRG